MGRSFLLFKTRLVRIPGWIVVWAQPEDKVSHVVGGDLDGDRDHGARLVGPGDGPRGKLAPGGLVIPGGGAPGVAAYPTPTTRNLVLVLKF